MQMVSAAFGTGVAQIGPANRNQSNTGAALWHHHTMLKMGRVALFQKEFATITGASAIAGISDDICECGGLYGDPEN
jgi:hypothetical protein